MAEPFVKPSHKGRLHRALGVPEGQKIPAARVEAATHSKNPHMRQMAVHAQNMQKGENAKRTPNMARGGVPKTTMPAPPSKGEPGPMPPNLARGRKVPNMAKGTGKWAARKGEEGM